MSENVAGNLMLIDSSKIVTPTNGPRPAGKPDECFYCKQKISQEHKASCPCLVKVVMVKIEVTLPRLVPLEWDADDIDFQINESSWCANNIKDEINDLFEAKSEESPCLCSHLSGSYVRDATPEDVEGLDLDMLASKR